MSKIDTARFGQPAILAAVICALLSALPSLSADPRTWTSLSGATVEAEHIKSEGGTVYLRKADGTQLAIPLERLSESDREYVRDLTPAVPPREATGSSKEWIGYGGPNGTRIYKDCNPPTTFDHTTGQGVKWETPLPSWGHGSPIAVKNRVIVLCEPGPKNLFPLIVCLSADTGKILWQKEISAPEQDKHRDALKAWSENHYRQIQSRAKSGKPDGSSAGNAPSAEEVSALMGLQLDCFRDPGNPWCLTYICIGEAYGVPVSDGARVWACTTWGSYVCYDLDGNVLWSAYDPRPGLLEHPGGVLCCISGRSPIIHGNMLISDTLDRLRAFDKNTGKLLWHHKLEKLQDSIATPAVITVNGRHVLLCDGPNAFLLPEGKPLKIEGWKDTGMQFLVKHDEPDVVFFCGAGEHCAWTGKGNADIQPPAAFRFSLNGDTLTGALLWDGSKLGGRKAWGDNTPWMLYYDGKFYHKDGVILEALTGKILNGSFERHKGVVPKTDHLLAFAGGHIFALNSSSREPRAVMEVRTPDGTKVASNPLVRKEPTPAQQAVHQYCTGNPMVHMDGQRKPMFSYGCAFTFNHDSIFIRSIENLICIGK